MPKQSRSTHSLCKHRSCGKGQGRERIATRPVLHYKHSLKKGRTGVIARRIVLFLYPIIFTGQPHVFDNASVRCLIGMQLTTIGLATALTYGTRLQTPCRRRRALRDPSTSRPTLPSAVYGTLQIIRDTTAVDTVKLAFEFIVLNAPRSGEVRGRGGLRLILRVSTGSYQRNG